MLTSSSSAEPKLTFDRLTLRCDASDRNIVNTTPWNWSICAGEKICLVSSNSFLKDQLMATLSGFIEPVSGDLETFGSLSWPVGGEGGLDSKLTIDKGLEFLSSIYSDCLEVSLVSVDEFFDVLQSVSIDASMSLKDLVKGQKDFFYMMLSILFSFDIYLVPRSKFLMTKEAKPLRNLLHKQLSDSKSLVTVTVNNRFRREFCNRGMVLGPLGEILFHGDLEEAIAYEQKNVMIGSRSQSGSEENQFDLASHLTNSNTSSDY